MDRVTGGAVLARRSARDDPVTRSVKADLSPRQREIVECVSRGMSNSEIAEEMGIAPSTVKSHLASVYTKMGVSNRTQAAVAYSLERTS
ncbi:MAG TPA: helix-turn-helix transcriptional regulator [Actinomycetota bacterium]|jgi:DNA-binding NarL/FixJ family response regulator